jgi:membrane protease subunit HflK
MYNELIPKTRGQALQMEKQAQAYAIERVNKAKGDATRFTQIYEEYKNNKEVTRKRMYLETMSEVLPSIDKKYIIDQDVQGLVPFMRLGETDNAK